MIDLPYDQETWLFGFWGCDDYFDPRHDLVEEMRRKHDDMSWEPDWEHFDNAWYERDVAKECFHTSMERIEEAFGFKPKITFQKIGGKRRDGLYVKVKVTERLTSHLAQYINDHFTDFHSWIEDRYKSRPGFIPHYSNDAYDWEQETNGFTDFTDNKHALGTVLKFCVTHHEKEMGNEWEEIDIYYSVETTYAPFYYSEPQPA